MGKLWAWLLRRRGPSPATTAGVELGLGAALMVGVVVLGIVLAVRPGPLPLDRWAVTAWSGRHLGIADGVTALGSLPALIVGAAGCAVVAAGQGMRRTLACLGGPVLASATAELVLKPLVGRHLQGVLTYPSGTVVIVAVLSAAATLAVRPRARLVVGMLGALLSTACALAVVVMRWHFASDALAGAAWGVGVVVFSDAVLGRGLKRLPRRRPAPVAATGRTRLFGRKTARATSSGNTDQAA